MQSERSMPQPAPSVEKPKVPISVEDISKKEIDYVRNYITSQFVRYGRSAKDPLIDDLTQKTLLGAVKNFNYFRGDAALTTWLTSIARHQIASEFRDQQKNKFLLSPAPFEDQGGSGKRVQGKEPDYLAYQIQEISKNNDPLLRNLIKQAATELDPVHQQTLVYILNEYKPEEIAEQEKIKPSTARTRYFYTLKKMREQLMKLGVTLDGMPMPKTDNASVEAITSVKGVKEQLMALSKNSNPEVVALLKTAAENLHPTQKQAIFDYLLLGKTVRQLAEEQKINIATANTRVRSALINLQLNLRAAGVKLDS